MDTHKSGSSDEKGTLEHGITPYHRVLELPPSADRTVLSQSQTMAAKDARWQWLFKVNSPCLMVYKNDKEEPVYAIVALALIGW